MTRKTAAALFPFALAALAAQDPAGPGGFGPPGGPEGMGGPQQGDLEVVARFDADHDGRLDAEERKDARAWLHDTRPQRGRGGRGGGPPGLPGGPFGGAPFPGGPGPGADAGDGPRARVEGRGVAVAPTDVARFPDNALFDAEVVRTFFLQFPQADWYEELADFYRTDVDVPATVAVDGVIYRDVGVHFRGNTSYMMAGRKKSMHLDFNFAIDGQRLYGHRATNLINNNEDPSLLHETIGAFVATAHTQAPRANLARVVINGGDSGLQ